MLMKIGRSNQDDPQGLGVWHTGLSWYDEGDIHPITAKVTYAVPYFEVLDVTLDYDKKKVVLPQRMEDVVAAAAIDEYLQEAPTLKKKYDEKKRQRTDIDPLFEEA